MGRQCFAPNPSSLIVTLREETRLTIRDIRRYLKTLHRLDVSMGAFVETIHRAAHQAQRQVDAMLERIHGPPAVNTYETGRREDGVTVIERFFLRLGRGKGVVAEILAESFNGVLVSDYYAAYDHYPGVKRRYWVHLLRDFHCLQELYPEDRALACRAGAVRRLYAKAKAWAAAGGLPRT